MYIHTHTHTQTEIWLESGSQLLDAVGPVTPLDTPAFAGGNRDLEDTAGA